MSSDQVRAAFEAWVHSQQFPNHVKVLERSTFPNREYTYLDLEWQAWQAAWTASALACKAECERWAESDWRAAGAANACARIAGETNG